MNEYARRRAAVEIALGSPSGYVLSNNMLARSLGAGVLMVRQVRRKLESLAVIPRSVVRRSQRGYYIDVSRLVEVPSRKAI
jgi:hypothetical protein